MFLDRVVLTSLTAAAVLVLGTLSPADLRTAEAAAGGGGTAVADVPAGPGTPDSGPGSATPVTGTEPGAPGTGPAGSSSTTGTGPAAVAGAGQGSSVTGGGTASSTGSSTGSMTSSVTTGGTGGSTTGGGSSSTGGSSGTGGTGSSSTGGGPGPGGPATGTDVPGGGSEGGPAPVPSTSPGAGTAPSPGPPVSTSPAPPVPTSPAPPVPTSPATTVPPPTPALEPSRYATALGWGVPAAVADLSGPPAGPEWTVHTGSSGSTTWSADAAVVRSGVLTLTGRTDGRAAGVTWTGTAQRYGRWEITLRSAGGDGWRSLLALGPGTGTSVLAVRDVTGGDPARGYLLGPGAAGGERTVTGPTDDGGSHVWAVERTPEGTTFYRDGVSWGSLPGDTAAAGSTVTVQLDRIGEPTAGTTLEIERIAFHPLR